MLLSFIVPVYNVEKYLTKCVQSLYQQELNEEDFEVILVNDGSTDSSGQIAKEFSELKHNCVLIQKQNGGLSSARNKGIEAARGNYVFFVDSDDYLKKETVNDVLQEAIRDDLDIVSFDFTRVDERGNLMNTIDSYKDIGVTSPKEFLKHFVLVSNVTRYLFKRDFLQKNRLGFTNDVYHEDEEFTLLCMSYAKKIRHIETVVYYYLQRPNSIMNTSNYDVDLKKINDLIKICDNISIRIGQIDNKELNKVLRRKYEQLVFSILFLLAKSRFRNDEVSAFRTLLKQKGHVNERFRNLKPVLCFAGLALRNRTFWLIHFLLKNRA